MRQLKIVLHLPSRLELNKCIELAKRVQEAGLYAVSMPELIGDCSEDIFVRAAVLSQRFSELRIIANVVNPLVRHPVVLAMASSSCAKACKGKFILGLGSGSAVSLNALGIKDDRHPLSRLIESTEIIRKLVSGENLTYKGMHFSVSSVSLLSPTEYRIPIFIAAIRSASIRFAAPHADGILLSSCSSEQYVKNALNMISRINHSDNFDIACNILFVPLEDRTEAMRIARSIAQRYLSIPEIGETLLKGAGFDPNIAAEIRRGSLARLTEDILDSLMVIGDRDKLLERINNFEKLGVTMSMIGSEPAFIERVASIIGRA